MVDRFSVLSYSVGMLEASFPENRKRAREMLSRIADRTDDVIFFSDHSLSATFECYEPRRRVRDPTCRTALPRG